MVIDLRAHDVGDARAHRRVEQRAERHHAHQPLLAVQHEHVVDGAGLLAHLLAHVADRLVDGHLGPDPHVARVHQPAGVVLRVRQQRRHLAAGGLVQQREHRLALRERRGLDQVGRVVRRQAAQPRSLLARGDAQHDLGLIVRAQAEEEVLGLVARQQQERLDAIGVREQRPDLADLPQRQRLAFSGRRVRRGPGFHHTILTDQRACSGRYSQAS